MSRLVLVDAEKDQAFRSELCANPYDTDTRLIYADFLEDHGEDKAANSQRRLAGVYRWIMLAKSPMVVTPNQTLSIVGKTINGTDIWGTRKWYQWDMAGNGMIQFAYEVPLVVWNVGQGIGLIGQNVHYARRRKQEDAIALLANMAIVASDTNLWQPPP